MRGNIFISYRRDDSASSAGRLYDRLITRFPSSHIFMDVDNLDPGVDFVEAIEESVGSCDVLIAVIGRNWLSSSDKEGQRRLDNTQDFVRVEIANALKRHVRVIPVLVDGASMPRSPEVPDDLKPLIRRNALEISHTRFNADCERLISAVERAFEKTTEQRERDEKERLEAERREREEKARLEAGPHETEANERVEVERRQKEEHERLNAERREREQQARLEAERRACEERERPETEQRQRLEQQRLETENPHVELDSSTTEGSSIGQPLPSRSADTGLRSSVLDFVTRFSFVPFALAFLSFLLPFSQDVNGLFVVWATIKSLFASFHGNRLLDFGFISACAAPLLMLVSQVLKYQWKGKIIVETSVSWFAAVFYLYIAFFVPGMQLGGPILACVFLTSGAVIKTFVLIYSNKTPRAA